MSDVLSEVAAQVGFVRLNRPAAHNALSQLALQRLAAALRQLDADPEVRCLLLAGGERAFATGTELTELMGASPLEMEQNNPLAALDELARLEKPLVAAVRGYALGSGCELALACDILVAAEDARFGLPQVNVGVMPGAGGTQRLTRVLGRARAMDLVLSGRSLTAREALELGLVSRVVPRENCEAEAWAVCREICQRPPVAVRLAKRAIRQADELALAAGCQLERQLFNLLFATDDQKEGMRAFLEKRPPVFVGR
ncbi:MAG: enoyl-CoA hydratase-related protein [Planctomycetota bacterium]